MRKLAYAAFVVVGLLALGCNKEGGGSTSGGGEAKPASGGGDIGVPECDDYLKKMEACLGKMPAEARSASENAFKQSRDAWKQAAATEAGKSALKQGCQSALDALNQNPMCK